MTAKTWAVIPSNGRDYLRGSLRSPRDQVEGVVIVANGDFVPAGKSALRIAAVAGARTGLPLVHIGRGSMRGELAPDEARGMAIQWVQAATAAQIDVRMRYALGEWDRLNVVEIEELFTLIQGADGSGASRPEES